MNTRSLRSSLIFSCILVSFFAQSIPGLADNNSSTLDSGKEHKSAGVIGLEILIIVLGILAVTAFAVFLFKLWQRKKREEQHARLLKLFDDDDELEVEPSDINCDPDLVC